MSTAAAASQPVGLDEPAQVPVASVTAAAIGHACASVVLLAATPWLGWMLNALAVALFALGLCWGANTVSHIHLHRPLFRTSIANRGFSLLLTLSLAVPQSWWKRRHLAHHGIPLAASSATERASTAIELGAVACAWTAVAIFFPRIFVGAYLPGWLLGLALCWVQGHYEHAGAPHAAGVDCHRSLYNRLWFNDGYHAAHHHNPTRHWTAIARAQSCEGSQSEPSAISRWPPLLRWIDPLGERVATITGVTLDLLERLALRAHPLRRLLIVTHRRAMETLLQRAAPPCGGRVCIIGGGLFPRTALILRTLRPDLRLVIMDGKSAHLERARALLAGAGDITFVQGLHDARDRDSPLAREIARCDLLVIPLAYRGDRDWLYQHPPTRQVIIHDWFWRRRGDFGVGVSPWLLKRMNSLRGRNTPAPSVTLDDEPPWPHPLSASRPPPLPHSAGATGKRS